MLKTSRFGSIWRASDFLLSKRVAFVPPLIGHKDLLARINIGHRDLPVSVMRADGPIAGTPLQKPHESARLQTIGESVGVLAMMHSD
jgi:hypothetical protein